MLEHGAEVAGEPSVVQDDHRLRARPDRGGQIRRIEIEVVRADDVAEDRGRTNTRHRIRRRHEVERRKDHLVARPAVEGEEGEVERGRPARDGERVRRPRLSRELRLEIGHTRAHAPPARGECLSRDGQELVVD